MLASVEPAKAMTLFRDPRMESPRHRLIGPIRAATFGFFVITGQSLMTESTAPPEA